MALINAKDAFQVATEANDKKRMDLEKETEAVLTGIYNTIFKAANEGKFNCSLEMERTANCGHTATLMKLPIYVIDGGGMEANLTAQGKYIESQLKENGYKVDPYGMRMEISWKQ